MIKRETSSGAKKRNKKHATRLAANLTPSLAAMWSLAVFLLVFLIKCPEMAAGSVRRALGAAASGLVPSLFPFLVLVNVITATGLAEMIAKPLGKPFSLLFGINGAGAAAFLVGAVGGFPSGAVMASALCENGKLTRDEAERLSAISNNPGIAFCAGGIGISLYNSAALGRLVWLCCIVSSVLVGAVSGRVAARRGETPSTSEQSTIRERVTPGRAAKELCGAVVKACGTMLNICAFVVFFTVLSDVISAVLTAGAGKLAAAVAVSFCEITSAARLASGFGLPAALPLTAFAAGFSGICVHMQVSAATGGRLGTRGFFFRKLISGVVAAGLAALSCLFIRS